MKAEQTRGMTRRGILEMVRDSPVWLRGDDTSVRDILVAGLAHIAYATPGWVTLAVTVEGRTFLAGPDED